MDVSETINELRDPIDRIVWVLEAYTVPEDICRRMRKSVPAPAVNSFFSDVADIIEATSTP